MPNIGDKVDHTADLPDELLHLVFSFLSLRDKLRVESVSHRFQRCVLKLMKLQPQPLELDNRCLVRCEGPPWNRLNAYRISEFGNVLNALRSLANKSKFNHVKIGSPEMNYKRVHMNALFSVLSETDCLDKVVSFECRHPPSQALFEKVFAQCGKLSSVTLNFVVHVNPSRDTFALDLSRILSNKPLTRLDLKLNGYPQDQLVELFHSLKPETLKHLSLVLHQMPPLDLAALVRDLHSTKSWDAVQQLDVRWEQLAQVHLAELFDSFALMPALEECYIHFGDIQPNNQFVAAMNALFKSNVKIMVRRDHDWYPSERNGFFGQVPGCQVLAQIRQVQNVHPNVFISYRWPKNLEEDNICLAMQLLDHRFVEEVDPKFCDDAHCVDCHRFYPNVIQGLEAAASDCTDMHLEDYQLERCQVKNVNLRLQLLLMRNAKVDGRFVSFKANETEDLVTISLQTNQVMSVRKFKITLACVPCFSSSCIRCVNIQ